MKKIEVTHRYITISGGIHNTAPLRVRAEYINSNGLRLSPFQAWRIRDHMCGIEGCTCGPAHGWIVEGVTRDELLAALDYADYERSITI